MMLFQNIRKTPKILSRRDNISPCRLKRLDIKRRIFDILFLVDDPIVFCLKELFELLYAIVVAVRLVLAEITAVTLRKRDKGSAVAEVTETFPVAETARNLGRR